MSTILTAERDLYSDVWTGVPKYDDVAPGEVYLPLFLQMTGAARGTILDAGCGSGKGALALAAAGFTPTLCDLTSEGLVPEARALPFREACLWRPLRPQLRQGRFDWIYCTDVLEHLPTQFTMLAIDHLLQLADRALFLTVAFLPDNAGAMIGRPLHLTVQPYTWWRDSLREMGRVVEARDLTSFGVFLVRDLMRDLKAIGAHNANAGRPRGLTGKGALARMTAAYEAYRRDGRLPATYEVVYGHPWCTTAAPRKSRAPREVVVPIGSIGRRRGT